MEANFGGEAHRFYPSSMLRQRNGDGKRSLDWDLNDWKWDSDLFIATPINSDVQPPDCRRTSAQLFPPHQEFHVLSNSSSSCSDDIINPVIGNGKGKRELEKRRRVVICEDSELNDQPGNLSLNLGDHVYPIAKNDDEKNGKKTKTLTATTSNRAVCQVEGCVSDLSIAKDYHRRHKVCEMHSKASKALVGNVMQRFCQQCSRFHVLQEFDEGKRSCRRRLAGHNRRRRKTHPETTLNGGSLNDDQSSNYLLISLLRILTNMHSNNSEQAKDQDLLSHLLRNLASYDGTIDGQNVSGKVQESKEVVSVEATAGASSEPWLFSSGHETSGHLGSTSQITKVADSQGPQNRAIYQNMKSAPVVSEKGTAKNTFLDGVQQTLSFGRKDCPPANAITSVRRTGLNNFDLNYAYSDSQDYGGLENSQHVNLGSDSPNLPSWMQKESHQSSPPQTSLNSDSLSSQSPSTSGGDAQSRTDRIVFKLFGKDPNHFPVGLRSQILNWLSHSPTDIESYIRPGCVILTIYLRLADSTWQELQDDLTSSLSRLLAVSDDFFWSTGWVFTRVQHRIAFIYNGQIVLDTALPLTSWNHSRIASVTPIAVSVSESAMFLVKGYNLSRPTARLLCALEGKYLIQEATSDLLGVDALQENNEIQCLSFPCSIPNVTGRGFLEVEDHGLSSGFFPFIVAEQDVCSEIRMLESAVEVSEFSGDKLGASDNMGTKNQAVDFINEMGWLLRRSCLRSKLGQAGSNSDIFPFTRFRWLLEFSMDHDWCAVVKKLLDVLFHGNVSSGDHSSVELALLEVGLLHRAVRRRCKEMVELLLRYVPHTASGVAGFERNQLDRSGSDFLFRPDAVGPLGLTPLHIAASSDGSENLLDLLTDDPGLVGVTAWKTIRDKSGLTPEDYARLRGHYGYIQLVHKKINRRVDTGHVILDIPSVPMDYDAKLRQTDRLDVAKVKGLQIDRTKMRPIKMPTYCKVCDQQVARGNIHSSLVYRPAMLSMLAIAAVCVCVSLLFKSSPEVVFVNQFRWELLKYGSS